MGAVALPSACLTLRAKGMPIDSKGIGSVIPATRAARLADTILESRQPCRRSCRRQRL